MSNNADVIESEIELINETKPENNDQNVIKTEPKTEKKEIISSEEELARLGLRENPPDPLWCFCCIFCCEAFFTASGGAPVYSNEQKFIRKVNNLHNWDNDSYDDSHDTHDNQMDWALAFANNISGNHNTSSSGHCDTGHHSNDCAHGDGGDGGGGDGGGGDGGGGD